MNRTEFINLILDKRSLNKEVYDLSLKIDDFPIARQVLNKIWGNINLDLILKSNKLIDINSAKGDLIANTVNFINDSRLKSETKRFIEDLVDQKILGSNFKNIEITNRQNKNNNKTKQINNSSKNKLIRDLGNSTNRENIVEQIPNNKNSQTDKSPTKKRVKNKDFSNKSINKGELQKLQKPEKERKESEEIRKRVLQKSKYLIPLFSLALLALIPIQIYKTKNNTFSEINSKSRYQETINYLNGDKYIGGYKDGKKNGQGTFTWANGNKYVGEYKNDVMHGQGTFTWASGEWEGDKYVGEYKDGKRHGQGTYTYASGSEIVSYAGEWRNHLAHGQGTTTWANGNKHIGEYKNDVIHGQGTFTWANGDKYIGEFKDGKRHSQGTFTWTDGNKYVGEHKDGKWNGQGTYTWAHGDKYVGEYKDGKSHGQGTYTWANGDKYVGEYKLDKRHGQGTYTWANGDSWTGQWVNNNKNLSTGQWASGYRNDSAAKYSLKEQLIREKEAETMSIKNYKNKCYSMYKNAKYIDVTNIMTLNYFVNKDNTITTIKWHLNKLARREPYCEIGKNLNGILNQTITSSCPTKKFFSKKNTTVTIQRQTFLTEESRNMAPYIGLGLHNKIPPGKTKNFLVIYERERPCSKESNWSAVSDKVIGLAVDIPRNTYYDYYGYKYDPRLK